MTRLEFLKELEYLLQDIDDKDRQDALDYYRDYMEEAGVMDLDHVEGLFESPEKIAISLRTSLNEDFDDKIESGDQGFRNMHAEEAAKVPKIYGQPEEDEVVFEEVKMEDSNEKHTEEKKSSLGKVLLIAATCIVAAPIILGIGGTLVGLVFGFFGLVIGLVFGIAGGALGCLVGGLVLFVTSILKLVISVPKGIFMMGVALLLIAAGILLVMLTVVVFKRFFPWLIRSIVNIFHKVIRKDGGSRL
jgi:uncharacterized membrane protein